MTVAQIQEVVEAFRVGARNAKEAGFDGVELHHGTSLLASTVLGSSALVPDLCRASSAQGYLLHQVRVPGRSADLQDGH